MAKERNAVRAGVFMLVSVALVIFVVIAISGASRFTESFKTYPVAFGLRDDIGGLRAGDDVRVGGLKVGDVRDIEIRRIQPTAGAETSAVIVTIDIPAKYPLAGDADVHIQRGLTGAAAINIDSFGGGAPLTSGAYLRGQPDALSGLMQNLGAMGPDLRQVVSNFRTASEKVNTDLDKLGRTADTLTDTGSNAAATVRDLRDRVPAVIDRYNGLVSAGVRMLDAVREFIGPPAENFHDMIANLDHVTGDLRQNIPDILDRTKGILGKVDGTLTRAAAAMQDIQGAIGSAHHTLESLDSIVGDNRSKLNEMISSLKTTSENLKYASMEIRHSPWRLLYQPKPDEVGNLNIYDSVRQFAEGADSLDDAAAALRDALKDPHADPAQVKKLMEHLDDSFSKFQQVQQKLWTDVKG